MVRAAYSKTSKELIMDIFEVIKRRYSCRAYQDKAIEPDKLARVLEAARLAPSAKNFQDWRFVIVTDVDTKARLAEAANNQHFVGTAAAVIVACSNNDHVMTCGQAIGPIDVAIALEHIALQAVAEGLATCWIGAFQAEKVRSILGIPAGVAIIELMPIGYPADRQRSPKREPIEKIVCYKQWQFDS